MTKFIVVVGGVISGVGKGVASGSIARIMKEYGFNTTIIKIDPYINYDAGTLRPTEHGEVWVTEDGGETDQDLGNYERFLGENLPKKNNITTGQIYKTIIEKERRGEFLGKTVQFIPHVPEEIKKRVMEASQEFDVSIIEIGGTIGDYENIPFLFSMRALERELGKDNIIYVMVTYLPVPGHIDEMKTKPTQTAVKLLRENGIQPDFILCRGKNPLDDIRRKKIEVYSNVKSDFIISAPDVVGPSTVNNLYCIPLNFEKEKLSEKMMIKLRLTPNKIPDWQKWNQLVKTINNPDKKVKIAIVGKYLDIGDYNLKDSYISINESLIHAGANNNCRVEVKWINSKEIEEKNSEEEIKDMFEDIKGIIVPGGFGASGVEGKIKAIKFARENNIPFLGLCFGMQLAVVEFARNVAGLENANTSEVNENSPYKVIDILPEQKNISDKGATMRLGAYPAIINGKVKELYGFQEQIFERHRHRYEVNPEFHSILQEKGLRFSGMSPDRKLVEFIELPEHKFFIATQAHPEFKSNLLRPAPLFDGFIKSCFKI